MAIRFKDLGIVSVFFTLLYCFFRSPLLASDGFAWIKLIEEADFTDGRFAELSHLIQIPLLALTHKISGLSTVFLLLSYNLVTLLAGIISFACFCEQFFRSRLAFYLGSLLFGTSLAVWFEWNGEIYAGALGFSCLALLSAWNGRTKITALLFTLSTLSHLEFVFLGPALAYLVWLQNRKSIRSILIFASLSGVCALLMIGAMAFGFGKAKGVGELYSYFLYTFSIQPLSQAQETSILRAAKGLFSAFSVTGHFFGDLIFGRLPTDLFQRSLIILNIACIAGGVVLFGIRGWLDKRSRIPALLLLLPVELFFNRKFYPSWMEYHSAAMIGFNFLLVAGLIRAAGKWPKRYVMGFVALCVLTNLFGSVIPARRYAVNIIERDRKLKPMFSHNKVSLIYCEGTLFLSPEYKNHFIVRDYVYKKETYQDPSRVTSDLLDWTSHELGLGHRVYLLGDSCHAPHWQILANEAGLGIVSKTLTDFYFNVLDREYVRVDTKLGEFYLDYNNQADPLSWQKARLMEVVRRN